MEGGAMRLEYTRYTATVKRKGQADWPLMSAGLRPLMFADRTKGCADLR
jgi:hypothetical protein